MGTDRHERAREREGAVAARAFSLRYRQQGSALIIGLIVLLLLTILGLSAMQGSTMQERMSGNMKDRNSAFQASEAALREGERWVEANHATQSIVDRTPVLGAWDGATPAPTGTYTGLDSQLAADPSFHVGSARVVRVNPGELPAEWQYFFPVTSFALGGAATTIVVLQSTYEALN